MPEIRTVAVIGAGATGRSIARLAAVGRFRTILEDILPASLRKAESEIRAHLDQAIEAGGLSSSDAEVVLRRLEYASSLDEAAREADLVIEAVPDELESKLEIFTLLDKVCKPHTIVASNTASLSITDLASVTYRARKILGMRFFAPGQDDNLVQLVRAAETDDDTIVACTEVARRMGKKVVVITEGAAAAHNL